MRVLVVSYTSLLQAHYRRKVDALAELPGVSVEVLVPPVWRELWSDEPVALELGDPVPYPLNVGRALFTGNLHLAMFREKLWSVIRRFRPDVIDLEDEPFNLGSLQMLAYRRAIRPRPAIVLHASQNAFKRYPPPFCFAEHLAYRQVARFLARTETAASLLVRKGVPSGRVCVLPHGVDVTQFRPLRPAEREGARDRYGFDGFTVGFVGTTTHQKGVSTLLAALSETSGVNAAIIGDGPAKADLRSLAGGLGLNGRARFMPAMSHHELPFVMGALDALVLPSVTQPGVIERFGRVLLEGMACGIPVIGSTCGEIPRVLGGAGIVFDEGDARQLGHHLARLRDEPDERERLAALGRMRAESEFSWKSLAPRVLGEYERATSGPGRR